MPFFLRTRKSGLIPFLYHLLFEKFCFSNLSYLKLLMSAIWNDIFQCLKKFLTSSWCSPAFQENPNSLQPFSLRSCSILSTTWPYFWKAECTLLETSVDQTYWKEQISPSYPWHIQVCYLCHLHIKGAPYFGLGSHLSISSIPRCDPGHSCKKLHTMWGYFSILCWCS